MKSQQKYILTLLIIGLVSIIIIMYFSGNWNKENQLTSSQPEKFKLFEVRINSEEQFNKLYGQVISEVEMEVTMNISGKIDDDNHSLKPGTSFKKNDILIKVDRLKILYELLTTRAEYKTFLQESIQEFPIQMGDKKEKWDNYKDQIERTQFIPSLPKVSSKDEENYLTSIGLYAKYYKIKKLELEAESYIYAAPFNGVILESKIQPGSMVKKNTTLMRISKQNGLIVKSNIPIHLIQHYENSKLVYYVNAKQDTIGQGKFTGIGSKLSDSSTVEGLFSIVPQNLKTVSNVVQILLPEESTNNNVILPKSAVKNDNVLIFESNKILEKSIQVISIQNDSLEVKGLPSHCFVVIPPNK